MTVLYHTESTPSTTLDWHWHERIKIYQLEELEQIFPDKVESYISCNVSSWGDTWGDTCNVKLNHASQLDIARISPGISPAADISILSGKICSSKS